MTDDIPGTEPVQPEPEPDLPWTDEALLAVEAVVLAVPGVTDLYRGRTSVGNAVGSAVAAVRRIGSSDAAPRIAVDGTTLRIVIGTDGAAPAPTVAHAVHDAVLAAARATGRQPTRIDVRVARIG